MRQTSLLSYDDLRGSLGIRQSLVLNGFRQYCFLFPGRNGGTDTEVARFLGKSDPNFVRPRRNELVKLGLLVEGGHRVCTVTNRLCLVWKPT